MGNALLDHVAIDVGRDVGTELGEIFGLGARRITLHCAIDNALRQRRIELAAGALRHQDQRVAHRRHSGACTPPTTRSERIGELLLLAGATAAATMLISAIWPTLGPCAANGPSVGACAANSGGDIVYLRDVLALRAGGPWHFELTAMEGIITMPSYHTVMAVLFTYAFRRTGLVGYGIATLNVVMLLSIPPIGGHYLVDVLAGGALALGAIAVQRARGME